MTPAGVAFQHGRTTPKSYTIRTPCPFHLSYDLVAVSSQVLVQPGQDYMQFRVEHEGGSVWSLRRESDEADVARDSFGYSDCLDFKRTAAMMAEFHDVWLS